MTAQHIERPLDQNTEEIYAICRRRLSATQQLALIGALNSELANSWEEQDRQILGTANLTPSPTTRRKRGPLTEAHKAKIRAAQKRRREAQGQTAEQPRATGKRRGTKAKTMTAGGGENN